MQINPWLLVLIGAIAGIAGYGFGMLDSRVTKALKDGREKAAEAEEPAPAKLDEHSVLKVTLDPALKWHLELDGNRIEPDGLTPEQRTRLVNVLVQVRPWVDGKMAAAPAANMPVAAPVPAPVASAPASGIPMPASAASATQPADTTATRLDLGRGIRTLFEKDFKKPEVLKGPSIVALIDEVLQKKLLASPLADRRIRLEEGSLGEVIVFVGQTRYSGVDAVPDESIKAIIREAIADWDKK